MRGQRVARKAGLAEDQPGKRLRRRPQGDQGRRPDRDGYSVSKASRGDRAVGVRHGLPARQGAWLEAAGAGAVTLA
jgi:hypothetical protein